ncbi:hypothetical protein KKG29_05405 [Patescibacteria group bacterium]|nr:hypothetical protein [Patescibacteria group bacterium]
MKKFGIIETSNMKIRPAKNTEYFKLPSSEGHKLGVTHHSTGLGKLKVFDEKENKEYGVPIIDILNKPLKDWRIKKK